MIGSIKARLDELLQNGTLKILGGSAEFQAAAERGTGNPTATPACYVYPLGEAAAPSQWAGAVLQKVRAAVSVTLCVRNISDAKGDAALADMQALRKKVKQRLYGWVPLDDYDPLERGDSSLLAFREGHVWWQDIYLTSYNDRSEQ